MSPYKRLYRTLAGMPFVAAFLALMLASSPSGAVDIELTDSPRTKPGAPAAPRRISLVLRQADLSEAMAMIAKAEKINILLARDVTGEVSVNLRDVGVDDAIRAIAGAAGFAVEQRGGTYLVVKRDEVGKYARSGLTQLRTFKVQYSKPEVLEGIIKNHLSAYGKITKLAERKLLVVEDMPEFLDRVAVLLRELDREPKQIMIEAHILEVSLTDNESFGLDWRQMFQLADGRFSIGVQGLNKPKSGLDIHLINPTNADLVLKALRERGRVRTLSTPKLLALEDQEAQAVIGDRQGYKVTTTINQVTTESIQFLESGVILKVTPSVDARDRILLAIHPEVSRGTVSPTGIPSQATTEVTTNMLVEDGQTVFIGGLIKQETNDTRDGVPVLGDLPLIGRLFSNEARNVSSSETIVLITPRIVGDARQLYDDELRGRAEQARSHLKEITSQSESGMRLLLDHGR